LDEIIDSTGVQGLSGFLKRLGIDHNNGPTTHLSHNSSTLAIDGDGLIFHLFRLTYYRHRKNVLSSSSNQHDKLLQSQLLLPTLVPLSLAHDVTTSYLNDLTTKHGVHLKIFFDGPNQYMKRRVKQSRAEQRSDEWENVRLLCIHGALPESGVSKFRSSATRQRQEYEQQMNGKGDDAEAELYLSSFPVSSLVMAQIERSIRAFESMDPVLPFGSIQVIQCNGEADADVSKASADDKSGMTYALACDSDYLIYGYDDNVRQGHMGETQYLQFQQIYPSADELCVGNAITRSEVATSIGLPCSSAMVELSILMGNDYTKELVKGDPRKEYWESIQWCKVGEEDCGDGERLPPESELSWHNVEAIVEHIAEKVESGLRLTSDNDELKLAIEFSYALYSFGDISDFSSNAVGSKEVVEDDESVNEVVDTPIFPALPSVFNEALAETDSFKMDLIAAALSPLASYKSRVGSADDELKYVEPRHMDAFRMSLEIISEARQVIGPPRHRLNWGDLKSLYVIEKCLLEAIDYDTGIMPYEIFDQSAFHSCLESMSFDDFALDNELVSNKEKAFIQGVTTELPSIQEEKKESADLVLPIDEHKDEILNTVKTQRVTIIHGETGKLKWQTMLKSVM
jgi:hypothetical protein